MATTSNGRLPCIAPARRTRLMTRSGDPDASSTDVARSKSCSAATRFNVGAVRSEQMASRGSLTSSSPTPTASDAGARCAFHRSCLAGPRTVTRARKKEGMVVKLVPILHSSAVDFGGHAARKHKRAGIDGQLVAPLTDFERSVTRRCPLTPLGVNAEFVFDTPETFFERAGHRRGNSAGVSIETEDTAECLEPERIGQATKQLRGTAIGNDVCGDSPARRVIRVNSHAGARPGCTGRLAKPGRVAIATRLASA